MISDQQESGTTHEGCNLVFHGEKDDNMRIMISLRCNSLNKDEAEVQQSVVAGSETRGISWSAGRSSRGSGMTSS